MFTFLTGKDKVLFIQTVLRSTTVASFWFQRRFQLAYYRPDKKNR